MKMKFLAFIMAVIFIKFTATRLIFDATAKAILKICDNQDLTANLILPVSEKNNLDFLDGISEIIEMASVVDPKCPFRVEFLSNVSSQVSKSRRFYVIIVESSEEFFKILSITSKFLSFKKLYLIALLNGTKADAKNIFDSVWKFKMFNADIIYPSSDNLISIATFQPFHDESCEETKFLLIDQFKDGKFIKNSSNFFPEKLKNLQGCPIKIATSLDANPCVFGEKRGDGSVIPAGSDVSTLNALSEVLNFKINYTFTKTQGFLEDDGTAEGKLYD